MAKVQVRVSVDPDLWSSLKYEGEKDTQLQDRIMAVISRLVKIDSDPMAALGKLESLGQVNEPITQLLTESVETLNRATQKLSEAADSIETSSIDNRRPQTTPTETVEEDLSDEDF